MLNPGNREVVVVPYKLVRLAGVLGAYHVETEEYVHTCAAVGTVDLIDLVLDPESMSAKPPR